VTISPARRAAFGVLLRIHQTGAFVDELLHGRLFESLSPRDSGLATEIILGTLRQRQVLDSLLGQALGRPLSKLDAEVLTALRLGAYQMRYLDRIPERAAVSESVELIKQGRKRSAAGLVNAALRKLPQRPAPDVERKLAAPAWLAARWKQHYGPEHAARIAAASIERPATYLRLSPAVEPEALARRLEEEGIETTRTELPSARQVVSGAVEQAQCWRDGLVRIQDLGAQMIVPLLEVTAQHRLLDLCAAPGGKSAQAAAIRGTAQGIVACDRHLHRLRILRQLSAEPFDLVALNAEQSLPFRCKFDRVLVDAPCSGTGTLARNPDLKWRLQPADIGDLAARQQQILANALASLAPDGIAVYATCSIEPEENMAVVEAVLTANPGWRVSKRLDRLPGRDAGDGFFAAQIIAA
jgi:16S rRNA (cytosine967-C5)-methyltransferase